MVVCGYNDHDALEYNFIGKIANDTSNSVKSLINLRGEAKF